MAIDKRFASFSRTERAGQGLRDCLLEALERIEDLAQYQPMIFAHLIEAIVLASEGRNHPAFSVDAADGARARPLLTNLVMQANAAALLEYGFTDLAMNQAEGAELIAAHLAQLGFLQTNDDSPYSAAAVIKWRAACIKRRHHATRIYDARIAELRDRSAGFALHLLTMQFRPEECLYGRKTAP